MEKIALNGAYYAVEFIKLMFTARCFFNIQIKRNIYFWFIISLIANMFLLPCNYIVDSNPLIYMISMYVVFFVALHDKKSIGWIIFTNISISILDIFISCIIMLFYPKSAELILNSSVFIVLINSISMVLFIFINCFIYKRKEKRYYLKNSDAYICIVCAIAVMIIIAPIQMWMLGYHDDFGVLSTLLAVALIVVSFFVLFYKKQREFINYEKDMVQELLNAQETYYNTLLKKDEETKCFRHDIKQYIFCLQMLQKEKRYNELDDYLSQMELRLNQICPDYAVGNEYINMILSELSTRFEDVKLDWVGKVPTLCMESMDICSLFYNLLKNSFEAVQNVNDKTVSVVIKVQENNLLIVVSNSYLNVEFNKSGMYKSTKKEDGHGYGIKNIKRCIKKYNGRYEVMANNGIFCTKITLLNVVIV